MTNSPIAHLFFLIRRLSSRWRVTLARASGTQIARGCVLDAGVDIQTGLAARRSGSVVIGEDCELAQGVVLHPYRGTIRVGRNVYLGQHTVIYGHGGVEIGDYTLIAMHCRIVSSNHAQPSPATLIRSQPDIPLPTRIGRDVWLGAGVTVLGGVNIGDGCIVGAGAVVTHDLPPNSLAVGVPARVTGSRT